MGDIIEQQEFRNWWVIGNKRGLSGYELQNHNTETKEYGSYFYAAFVVMMRAIPGFPIESWKPYLERWIIQKVKEREHDDPDKSCTNVVALEMIHDGPFDRGMEKYTT